MSCRRARVKIKCDMCKFMSSCVSFLVHFIYYLQNANNRFLNYKGTATQLMGYLIIYIYGTKNSIMRACQNRIHIITFRPERSLNFFSLFKSSKI